MRGEGRTGVWLECCKLRRRTPPPFATLVEVHWMRWTGQIVRQITDTSITGLIRNRVESLNRVYPIAHNIQCTIDRVVHRGKVFWFAQLRTQLSTRFNKSNSRRENINLWRNNDCFPRYYCKNICFVVIIKNGQYHNISTILAAGFFWRKMLFMS